MRDQALSYTVAKQMEKALFVELRHIVARFVPKFRCGCFLELATVLVLCHLFCVGCDGEPFGQLVTLDESVFDKNSPGRLEAFFVLVEFECLRAPCGGNCYYWLACVQVVFGGVCECDCD